MTDHWETVDRTVRAHYPSQVSEPRDQLLLIEVGALAHSDRGDLQIRDPGQWVWRHPDTPAILADLAHDYTIVIYDAARGDGSGAEHKLDQMLAELSFDPVVLISTAHDQYRPPQAGLFDLVEGYYNHRFNKVTVVGSHLGQYDADPQFQHQDLKSEIEASRDYLLAHNLAAIPDVEASYMSPTELLGTPPLPTYGSGQELIILVGQQGSGKTTFLQEAPPPADYVVIERKGSRQHYLDRAWNALSAGHSVLVDATNPSVANREDFIAMATQLSIPVRIWWLARPGRPYNALRPEGEKVPDVALRQYTFHFEPPVADVGRRVTVERIN